jgi:hypothetical protein
MFIHTVIISKQESQPYGNLPVGDGKNTNPGVKITDLAPSERMKASPYTHLIRVH